jgi:hypothetical protein
VDVVWIDAKVWINALRKISPYSLGLKSKAEIWAVPMGLRGTNVTCLLFFEWLALQVSVRLGAVKELRLYHPYRVAFIFVILVMKISPVPG